MRSNPDRTETKCPARATRAVRLWLWSVALLIAIMVMVGGATRLTESGLSIVEWKPVTGTLPPLSEAEWQAAFDAYKTIPQYHAINRGMTLGEFKTIFWWEWTHRLLGRLVGVAFLLPLLWFLWRGDLVGWLRRRLWLIFGLGALQGVVGWWMVASGLSGRTEVSQYRLAVHLTLAILIFAAIIWTAERLRARLPDSAPAQARPFAALMLAVLFLQIVLGALVAGLRAGYAYNTWPLIDGAMIPSSARLWVLEPWWKNLFETMLTVQFNHRMVAYALALAALCYGLALVPHMTGLARRWALAFVVGVWLQVGLGVVTLLWVVPILVALAHQAMALGLVTVLVLHLERLAHRASFQPSAAREGRLPLKSQQV